MQASAGEDRSEVDRDVERLGALAEIGAGRTAEGAHEIAAPQADRWNGPIRAAGAADHLDGGPRVVEDHQGYVKHHLMCRTRS